MAKARFKTIAEVHLVLERDEEFLMLHRFQTGYMDGYYSLVAGHVDGGETFKQAMAREALEEAGISIELEDLELVHTMHRLDGEERIALFFKAEKWSGEVTNVEPHKCDDLDWYTIQAKSPFMIPYILSAITKIGEGKTYSEFGWA
ncbi:MAG: NUDIX domain-containing protein [Hyphomicrobiales bacterium]